MTSREHEIQEMRRRHVEAIWYRNRARLAKYKRKMRLMSKKFEMRRLADEYRRADE